MESLRRGLDRLTSDLRNLDVHERRIRETRESLTFSIAELDKLNDYRGEVLEKIVRHLDESVEKQTEPISALSPMIDGYTLEAERLEAMIVRQVQQINDRIYLVNQIREMSLRCLELSRKAYRNLTDLASKSGLTNECERLLTIRINLEGIDLKLQATDFITPFDYPELTPETCVD